MLPSKDVMPCQLALSPQGALFLDTGEDEEHIPMVLYTRLQELFSKGSLYALLHIGIEEYNISLPPTFLFWQQFVHKLLSFLCKNTPATCSEATTLLPPPTEQELQKLILQAPFMKGGEYLQPTLLVTLWNDLQHLLEQERATSQKPLQEYLQQYNPRWNLLGRVCFHLAENKNDEQRPFAFLATYTSNVTHTQSVQHLPLKRALQEYAEEKNQAGLLTLLLPVQKAASQSAWIQQLLDSGALFQPQAWTAKEAYTFLRDLPLIQQSGIIIRVPNWWNPEKPPRPKISVTVGDTKKSVLGFDTLLDFDLKLSLDTGETLTQKELEQLLNTQNPFIKIKGQWVEVDKQKIESVLSHWKEIQQASKNGLSMIDALRLLAGTSSSKTATEGTTEHIQEWSTIQAGSWLRSLLDQLKNPGSLHSELIQTTLKNHLKGTLRPYQLKGVAWLYLLYQLKVGGCLADDMGLGKTIQILSLFLLIKHNPTVHKPHLLIVPASLIGTWQKELAHFAPSLTFTIAHSSATTSTHPLSNTDLVITTYGFLHRCPWIQKIDWDLIIIDEAQYIKNPNTKQTRAVKALKGHVRFTLTGTPIENRLGDLWSLFDFTSPGLLGSSKEFSTYAKKATEQHSSFIKALKTLTQPYILRRLKSDTSIIKDLPKKTEMVAYCSLSKEQAVLYQQAVDELAANLQQIEGIKRRGLVLASILRLKQICNHPTQWLGYGDYNSTASGKFIRLQELCEEIAAKQEKVLVFTQFREIIPALALHLQKLFGREGLTLHGSTNIQKRQALVEQFQQDQGPPFFILSLKAGGTGLTLTKASHVIHFDRWWNPAVENQATDRAYRIGQQQPVFVHAFVCQGTIEEKIDEMISSKKQLSKDILEGSGEISLTELSNEELLKVVSLDIHRVLE